MPFVDGVFGPDLIALEEKQEDDVDDILGEDEETESQDPEDSEGEPESTEPEEGVDDDGPEEDEGESEDEPAEAADEPGEEPKEAGEEDWSMGGQFKTPADLARSYREQKALMGRQAYELGQLRSQVAQLAQQAQQYQAYLANPQNILAAAERIRAAQAPQSSPALESEELPDPAQWLERFYQEGPKAVAQLMEKREARLLQRIHELEARMGQGLTQIEQAARQAVAPAQQYAALEQMRAGLQQQEQELRAELKKQGVNLDDYADDVVAVMKENKEFFRFPNGLRLAFDIARARRPAPKPNATARKKAARVTASLGSRPRQTKPDPDQRIVDEIFGSDGDGSKGVFG